MTENLTITLTLDESPEAAFAAINDVPSWWSGTVDGPTDEVGATFDYRYTGNHHSVQRVTELSPGARVVWHVIEANLPAVEPTDEWAGTDIVFDLRALDGGGTELTFTHVGLTPTCSCYDRCEPGWDALIRRNLAERIRSGQPQPDVFAGIA